MDEIGVLVTMGKCLAILILCWNALSLTASTASLALGASEFTTSFPDRYNDYTEARVFLNITDPSTGESRFGRILDGKYGSGLVAPARGFLRLPSTPEACDVTAWRHVAARHKADAAAALAIGQTDYQPAPWIALVRRSKCDFRKKVEAAFRVNASAVIVYNHLPDEEPLVMDLRTGSIKHGYLSPATFGNKIPAVFVKKEDGERWKEWTENGTGIFVDIIPGNYMSPHYKNINRTSILFVSVSFIVLMIVSLAWLVFYYVQRFRYIHAKDRLAKRLCCAAKKALANIPIKQLKPADKEVQEEGEHCAICIEAFKVADAVRVLPCKHQFHKVCVDQWLLDQRTCPMCKMDILKYYGLLSESQESIIQIDTDDLVSTPPSDVAAGLRGFTYPSNSEPSSHFFSRCGMSLSACAGGDANSSPTRSVTNSRPASRASCARVQVLVRTSTSGSQRHRHPSTSGDMGTAVISTGSIDNEESVSAIVVSVTGSPCRMAAPSWPLRMVTISTTTATVDVECDRSATRENGAVLSQVVQGDATCSSYGIDDEDLHSNDAATDASSPTKLATTRISENPMDRLMADSDCRENEPVPNTSEGTEEDDEQQKEDAHLLSTSKVDSVQKTPSNESQEVTLSPAVEEVTVDPSFSEAEEVADG